MHPLSPASAFEREAFAFATLRASLRGGAVVTALLSAAAHALCSSYFFRPTPSTTDDHIIRRPTMPFFSSSLSLRFQAAATNPAFTRCCLHAARSSATLDRAINTLA